MSKRIAGLRLLCFMPESRRSDEWMNGWTECFGWMSLQEAELHHPSLFLRPLKKLLNIYIYIFFFNSFYISRYFSVFLKEQLKNRQYRIVYIMFNFFWYKFTNEHFSANNKLSFFFFLSRQTHFFIHSWFQPSLKDKWQGRRLLGVWEGEVCPPPLYTKVPLEIFFYL